VHVKLKVFLFFSKTLVEVSPPSFFFWVQPFNVCRFFVEGDFWCRKGCSFSPPKIELVFHGRFFLFFFFFVPKGASIFFPRRFFELSVKVFGGFFFAPGGNTPLQVRCFFQLIFPFVSPPLVWVNGSADMGLKGF